MCRLNVPHLHMLTSTFELSVKWDPHASEAQRFLITFASPHKNAYLPIKKATAYEACACTSEISQ